MIPSITAKNLKSILQSNKKILIVDVREQHEYEDFHIPDSVCIPYYSIEKRFRELPKDRLTVIVCQTGKNSKFVTLLLTEKGYQKVKNLSGGIEAWLSLTS